MYLIPGIVASSAAAVSTAIPVGNLLTNGGFETGDLTGWSDDEAGFVVTADANAAHDSHDLDGINELPRSGSYAAWGTAVATARISQTIDVSAYADLIDAGLVSARAGVFTRDTHDDADKVTMALRADDNLGTELVTWHDATGLSVYGSWAEIVEEGVLPVGTRTLILAVRGTRISGTLMNVGVDDASLILYTPSTYDLTVVNGGAETADLTGWTTVSGVPNVATSGGAYAGTYYFYGGNTATAEMRQDLTIPIGAEGIVDAGDGRLEVEWRQKSYSGDDRASIDVEFYDGTSTLISAHTVDPNSASSTTWVPRARVVDVPTGTRTVRLRVMWIRAAGTNLDGRMDAIEARIRDMSKTVDLALTNPGAETNDLTGWTISAGGPAIRGGTPSPIDGVYYFFGGTSAFSEAYQDVVVPAAWESDVDAGNATVVLNHWHASYDIGDDPSRMSISFLDGTATVLGTVDGTYESHMKWWWAQKLITAAVPSGTRTIRVTMQFSRSSGTNNDGYIDSIEVFLGPTA